MLSAFDTTLLAYLVAVFVLGGLVKGVSGFGMPLVVVPLVAWVTTVPTAVALSLLPVVISNLSQAYECRRHYQVLQRVWPLLLGMGMSLALAVQLLGHFRPDVLAVIIGGMIQLFVISQLLPNPPLIAQAWQFRTLLGAGISSGVLGGMTSFYGFPALQALLAMNLVRGEFILASSLLFLLGSLLLGVGLLLQDLVAPSDLLLSLVLVLPTQVGMWLGAVVRERLSQRMFRAITLAVLSATGFAMIVRALAA